MTSPREQSTCLIVFVAGLCSVVRCRARARDIGHPGGHPHYGVELEPHLVLQWAEEPVWNDEGIGLGLRASIPVIQDGPVRTINNSLAIGFGLDWAHFDNSCLRARSTADPPELARLLRQRLLAPGRGAVELLLQQPDQRVPRARPGHPPLALWTARRCARTAKLPVCDSGGSDTDVEFVLWLGVRFHLSRSFAMTLRLGTPSLLLGASFFL